MSYTQRQKVFEGCTYLGDIAFFDDDTWRASSHPKARKFKRKGNLINFLKKLRESRTRR